MKRTPSRPLGAQISHMLKHRGVDVIFGIPGVHNQEMYRGIEEAGITHFLARHEQGAGFMADGYARATGGFGVCYLITGPGMLNALTPLGQAYSDNVSVLALCSCLDNVVQRKGQLHQMKDQEGAARTVCDWSETARDAQTAYGLVDRALQDFARGDPRPKAVHVPIQVLGAQATAAPEASARGHVGFPDDEFDTVGGLVVNAFGCLPAIGDQTKIGQFEFKVLNSDNRKITLLEVSKDNKS